MTGATARESVVVTDAGRRQAADFLRRVGEAGVSPDQMCIATGGASPVPLPGEIVEVITRVLRGMTEGRTVTVTTAPEELTTTVAARELNISRPTLMKLIREGRIPAHKVGSHTRLRTSDVLAYRDRRVGEREAAFEALRSLDEELGLDD